MVERKYNLVRDVPKTNDPHFSASFKLGDAILPPKVDLRPLCSSIDDQGQTNSCTSHATIAAIEFVRKKLYNDDAKYSRLYQYYNSRLLENDTNEDNGVQLRDAVLSAVKYGYVLESEFPFDATKIEVKPPVQCYTDGLKTRVNQYFRVNVNNDLTELKQSLADGYPVIFGMTVFESFESDQVAASGIVPLPKYGEKSCGGHAVLAVGYDDVNKVIIVRNSWGASFGMQGYFTLPYEFVQNPQLVMDFWTIRK